MSDSFRVRNAGSQIDMSFSVKVGLCCVSWWFVDSGDDFGVGAELVGATQKRPGRRAELGWLPVVFGAGDQDFLDGAVGQ